MEMPEFLHERASEALAMEADGAYRRRFWAVVLGLKPKLDGNQWCVLWGDNLQSGVAGFGKTPSAAVLAFEYAMDKANSATAETKRE
jgi:hypothetical protein